MPYCQLEYVYLDTPDMPATASMTGGLNVRPHESVTIKAQFGHGIFPGSDKRAPGRDSINALEAQMAWAF